MASYKTRQVHLLEPLASTPIHSRSPTRHRSAYKNAAGATHKTSCACGPHAGSRALLCRSCMLIVTMCRHADDHLPPFPKACVVAPTSAARTKLAVTIVVATLGGPSVRQLQYGSGQLVEANQPGNENTASLTLVEVYLVDTQRITLR